MSTRVLVLGAIIILGMQVAVGQSRGSIQGVVSDKESGLRVPFASISFLRDNQAIPGGAISDEEGVFRMGNLKFGSYQVVISFIGYETDTVGNVLLSRDQAVAHLGTVSLAVSRIALDEVEVRAMASTVTTSLDRKTYRAADFETARGGTAVDVLNRLPSVSVSPDGDVSVRGTTDFMVYLNGKPTQMDPSMLLGQISGEAIESIEVITVPSARYDAQGKGGIINISTRTSGVQGLSLTANGMLGGSPWGNKADVYSSYKMTDQRYSGGVNLLYGKENFSFYGGVNYSYKNVNGQRTGDARILDTLTNAYKHMVASGERPEWYENYSANAGFDYAFTEATSLSASYFYGNRTEGRSAFYVYHNFYGDQNKYPIPGIPVNEEWIYNPNTDNRYGIFHTANLELNQALGDKASLDISFLYEHSSLSRELDNYNYEYIPENDGVGDIQEHFKQADNTPLNGYRFSLDYAKEFDNGHTLGMGIQPQYFRIAGDFSYDTLDLVTGNMNSYTELENGIDLRRGIYAGYIDYSGSWDRFEILAGLRLEYTDQHLEIDNPDYFTIFDRPTQSTYLVQQLDWFPTLHASFTPVESSVFKLAASRRISRPPIKNMAPFLYRRHLEVYVVGDPALMPEYINSVELGFDQKLGKQKVNLTGFYRGVDNAIFRVNTVYQEEMVLIRSYTNSGNSRSLGAELNADFEAGNSFKFFLGGSLYSYRIQGDIFGFQEDNSSTNWSLKGNANINLSKQIKFTADFDMISATVTAQGSNEMFYFANAALTYAPSKIDRWSFALRVLDIFSSNLKGLDTRAFDSLGREIFYQETLYTRTGPIAEIGISYAFNSKGKPGKKSESSFGENEF